MPKKVSYLPRGQRLMNTMFRTVVLREFVRQAPGANRGYAIRPAAPLEEYAAIAPEHPVFRVVATTTKA